MGDYLPMLDAYTASACLSGTSGKASSGWSGADSHVVGTQPWARPILHRWLTRKLGSSGAAALGAKASVAVSRRLAELDKAAQAGDDSNLRKDVLSKLMSAKNPDGLPFSIAQVKVQANSILGAGSDTTSITFRALLAYIVKDPAVYNKVMQELEGAAEEGIVSLPLSYAAAQKLDYFQVGRTPRNLPPYRRVLIVHCARPASKRLCDCIPPYRGSSRGSSRRAALQWRAIISLPESKSPCRPTSFSGARKRTETMQRSSDPNDGLKRLQRRRSASTGTCSLLVRGTGSASAR